MTLARFGFNTSTSAASLARFRRLFSSMSVASHPTNGSLSKPVHRSNLVQPSSRLKEGRALAQDVWSIFKWVHPLPSYADQAYPTALTLIVNIDIDPSSAANLPADCINLGQGYMNFGPPKWVTEAAEEALHAVASNHYSHPKGRIRLREAIKKFYGPQFGRDLDVESEILVSSGANEGEDYLVLQTARLPYFIFLRAICCFHCFFGARRRSYHV